ncbi:HEPN domain-containing protein [Roseomonas sp. HF4]|uniref:HEPN domain-containing protein n=1 Tax=Roseomonas sp. HF4 TaxID=2562313 RepID=UPI0010C0B54C|nr:HEPN domain-containing protein [Roseomonas sp. HF4]
MTTATPPTSNAAKRFARAIEDAENLLKHFDTLNARPPKPDVEVLKRAGLIMAMTAWETYVEDRVQEAAETRIDAVPDATIQAFVHARLTEDINRLHNPTAEKTRQLFKDYAGVDLGASWSWNHYDKERVTKDLNGYLKLRGTIAHRARVIEPGPTRAQPVKKQDLQTAIRFLKDLVAATEKALAPNAP